MNIPVPVIGSTGAGVTRTGWRALLFAVCLLPLLAACSRDEPVYHEQFLAFGTIIDVTLYGMEPKRAHQAADAVEKDFNYMHTTWHAWKPSALTRVNEQLATTEAFAAPPSVLPLIVRSQELSRKSGGLFNPAIGQLLNLWGFQSDERPPGPPPSPDAIKALVDAHPGMDDLNLDGVTLRSSNPAVKLDFGGIAKGYGIDMVIDHLRQMGIRNAIINAGGNLRAIGRHGERPWRIGIRNPHGPGILASVEVDGDASVVTSGDYERYFEYKGVRYHHIIDPRTGYPTQGVASVTVIHDNAAEADVASTALLIAGPERWHEVARNLGIKYVMLITSDGTAHMNPAMAERVRFETEKPPRVVLSAPL